MNRNALIIFAKCPIPGEVNTRLQPEVSPEDSARLQDAFILDTIHKVKDIEKVDVFIGCSPSNSIDFFKDLREKTGIELFLQRGKTLGMKIHNAFSEMFLKGYQKIIIIGADSPAFPPAFITEAVHLLEGNDIVFGPTIDGGYYLVGMRNKVRSVFPDDDMGTDNVLGEALKKGSRLGLKISTLSPWYDLDRYSDLKFALTHIHLLHLGGKYFPPRTAKILEKILKLSNSLSPKK